MHHCINTFNFDYIHYFISPKIWGDEAPKSPLSTLLWPHGGKLISAKEAFWVNIRRDKLNLQFMLTTHSNFFDFTTNFKFQRLLPWTMHTPCNSGQGPGVVRSYSLPCGCSAVYEFKDHATQVYIMNFLDQLQAHRNTIIPTRP